MKYKILCGCAVFAFALTSTPAQTKQSLSGKCSKPDVEQSIPAGDAEGHTLSIAQLRCTAKGDVNGEEGKDGVAAEHRDGTAKHSKGWGVYVEMFEGGDKVFYDYQTNLTAKSDGTMSGSNKYQITGGTGKMKGIKGSGTCKLTGTADGGTEYSCTGEYTIAAAAPAKKYNKQNKEDNREGQAAELPFSLLLSATSEARVAVKFYCTCGLLLAQRPTAAFEIF